MPTNKNSAVCIMWQASEKKKKKKKRKKTRGGYMFEKFNTDEFEVKQQYHNWTVQDENFPQFVFAAFQQTRPNSLWESLDIILVFSFSKTFSKKWSQQKNWHRKAALSCQAWVSPAQACQSQQFCSSATVFQQHFFVPFTVRVLLFSSPAANHWFPSPL